MDCKATFENIVRNVVNDESAEEETLGLIAFWQSYDDPTSQAAASLEFMKQKGHDTLRSFILSKNEVLEEIGLCILDTVMATDSNRELRVFFSSDAHTVDFLVRCTGAKGEQMCSALSAFQSWSLQMLSLEIVDSLSEVYEARSLLVPRIAEMMNNLSTSASKSSQFSLYMAIAKLVGNSDHPQDLDVVNRKEVIEDIVFAFVYGRNRHNEDDSRTLMHTAPAIRALANNENLRKTLVECGIVAGVSSKLTSEEIKVRQTDMENVVGIVVNLAFDKSIADSLRKSDAVPKLKTLLQSPTCTGAAKVQVEQALWNLEAKAQQAEKRATSAKATAHGKHVMISYCWAQQPLILRLNKFLKANGISVWLDVEQMAGSTLEAMAGAVENSSVVLICLSQRYKESSNCQIEGEYVFSSKKPFLPVLVEEGYKASGWLGALLGSKLYYDVSKEQKFESTAMQLLEELLKVTEMTLKTKALPPIASAPTPTPTPTMSQASQPSAVDWSVAQVSEWLKKVGLEQFSANFEKEAIDGNGLRGLSLLGSQAFLQVTNTLGIDKVGHKMKFLHSVSSLFGK